MKILNYKMAPQVEANLKELLRDKIKRSELEEKIKVELLHELQGSVNPDEYTVEIKYNTMAGTFDIHLKRFDDNV